MSGGHWPGSHRTPDNPDDAPGRRNSPYIIYFENAKKLIGKSAKYYEMEYQNLYLTVGLNEIM